MRLFSAIFVAAMLAASSLASAQATRTWVSGVGDDANPCSRTAPCKTFAGAIAKTATAGEIDVLDPGGFGALTITKSITIDGGGFVAGVLVSGTNGFVISAPGATVTLRNLDFDGLSTGLSGVLLNDAAALHLENLVVYNFGANNLGTIQLTPQTGSTDVSLRNVRVSNCVANASGGGILFNPASGFAVRATLDRVQVSGCSNALLIQNNSTVSAFNSDFSHSSGVGALVAPSVASSLMLDRVMLTQNGTGISADATNAGATVRLSDSTVTQNTTGLQTTAGGVIISYNNNRLKGNTTDGSPTQNIYQH